MTNIAFYISDHGFGHAARSIPIIGQLIKNRNIKVFVKSGKEQIEFIKQSLEEHLSKVALFHSELDIGLVLEKGSLRVDEERLKCKLTDYINSWDLRINEEIKFLDENNVDLVISDIVPWVFKAAKELNIKSLFISNFTWVEIYENYFESYIYGKYLECYKLADKALLYELRNENIIKYFNNYEYVGLSLRKFNIEVAQAIKKNFEKPIVFVSVGRSVDMNREISVEGIDYCFIVTEGIKLVGNNVYYLPKDIENTQDYILASKFVITKAGWGTVAEVLCADKPMAVIARDYIEEDKVTTRKLIEINKAIKINESELLNIENIINKLNEFDHIRSNYKFTNDTKNITKKIVDFVRGDFDE